MQACRKDTANTDLNSVEDFKNLALKSSGEATIRLKDVAVVELGLIHTRLSSGITVKMPFYGNMALTKLQYTRPHCWYAC